MPPSLTIAVLCHNYQKRLCWLLSSLLEQTHKNFTVDVAHLKDNGAPETSVVARFFQEHGLSIIDRCYPELGRIEFRGLVRNDQLRDCSSPWILWADCDHVYAPEFIASLLTELNAIGPTTKCVSVGRMTMPIEAGNSLANSVNYVSVSTWQVIHAFTKAKLSADDSLRIAHRARRPGIGHTQIAHAASVPLGLYVPENRTWDRPWAWRSEVLYRRRAGSVIALPDSLRQSQIHLNHDRQPEDQREHGIQR